MPPRPHAPALAAFLAVLAGGSIGPLAAQADPPAEAAADPADVETLDGLVEALYASISGPAGPRPWGRFHSLFLPGAILMPASPRPDTLPPPPAFSPAEYRERVAGYFTENAFYEVESARQTHRFGTVAHLWSTYESRRDPGEEPFARGINSITAVHHDGRWWVASIIWDAEREGNAIPPEYLPSGDGG
jgi:hypothetical protein